MTVPLLSPWSLSTEWIFIIPLPLPLPQAPWFLLRGVPALPALALCSLFMDFILWAAGTGPSTLQPSKHTDSQTAQRAVGWMEPPEIPPNRETQGQNQ